MATKDMTLSPTSHIRSGVTSRKRIPGLAGILFYLLLLALAVIFAFPFFWAVSSSLKQVWELFNFPPTLFPVVPQWKNYATVMRTVPFALWVKNSLFIVALVTSGVIVTSSLVAYSFARFTYRGKNFIFLVTLATMMLPSQVTLIPQFILFNKLGWVNTLYPLWVPAWFGGGAFYIFLLRQFFMTLPADLDEAALIDGATYVQIYWSILLPLCRPALATVGVISFIGAWDDFLTPLIYLNSSEKFTVALGLNFFRNFPEQVGLPMQHLLMAASVMTVLPCIVLFFLAQRYFVEGIALSGIKG